MGRKRTLDPVKAAAADMIDQHLDKRLGSMERQVAEVGRDLDTVAKQVQVLTQRAGVSFREEPRDDEGEPAPGSPPDETWACRKCGQRLGFYSHDENVLRVRHKDHVMWIHPGAGGTVATVCRSCGELNTVEDDRPEPTPEVMALVREAIADGG